MSCLFTVACKFYSVYLLAEEAESEGRVEKRENGQWSWRETQSVGRESISIYVAIAKRPRGRVCTHKVRRLASRVSGLKRLDARVTSVVCVETVYTELE